MNKPLASVCITCFNQSQYIRAAIKSAFDQVYDPLEIVICDDCSTDATPCIVKSMVDEYRRKGGRHRVVFHRNDRNLGVAANYDQCFRMATGSLLVTGSGDDISDPMRVQVLVDAWLTGGCNAKVIHSRYWRFSDEGVLYPGEEKSARVPLGAVAAYSADVFTTFPPLQPMSAYEDVIFSNRALLLGDEIIVDNRLVKYRVGSGESTRIKNFRRGKIKQLTAAISGYEQVLRDIASGIGSVSEIERNNLKDFAEDKLKEFENYRELLAGRTFFKRWKHCFCGYQWIPIFFKGHPTVAIPFVEQLLFVLPGWLSDGILDILEAWIVRYQRNVALRIADS